MNDMKQSCGKRMKLFIKRIFKWTECRYVKYAVMSLETLQLSLLFLIGWCWPTRSWIPAERRAAHQSNPAAQCSTEGEGWQTQTERGRATTEGWWAWAKKCWHQQTSDGNKKVAGQCSYTVEFLLCVHLINPRRMRHRVTVVILCVCVCISLVPRHPNLFGVPGDEAMCICLSVCYHEICCLPCFYVANKVLWGFLWSFQRFYRLAFPEQASFKSSGAIW